LLGTFGTGCTGGAIDAAVKKSTAAYREHLRVTPSNAETPEQAARTAQLRAQLLHDEWVKRGYRVGNEKGGETILYTWFSKGPIGALVYPFQLLGEWSSYSFGGNRPVKWARQMESEKSADTRRRGIIELVHWDFAQNEPYTKRYRQIAAGDADPLVRATAIRALNRSRDAAARPIFITALGDAAPVVRLEAAKALANLPDPNAVSALVRVVSDAEHEERDVRIAAADALRHHPSLEVARALIPRLRENDFAIAWQSRRSLRQITGKDLGYDEAAWLTYITGPDKPFG
jgi:hypothetical protein